MKVYTHYAEIDGTGFRWRTLLQFGNSWNIIGSVVMKNPGTAAPNNMVTDKNALSKLSAFSDDPYDWFEFTADSTMNCVGDLFAYYYDKISRNELEGVIQIFNLFYLREGDLGKALEWHRQNKFPFASETEITEQDISQLKAPVYLGFAGLASDANYANRAKQFLDASLSLGMNYLSEDIKDNKFVHPQYLMLFGKYTPTSIRQRMQFKQNTLSPEGIESALADLPVGLTKADNKIIAEMSTIRLRENQFDEYEAGRFVVNDVIGVSVMKDGTIGYRPQKQRLFNYNTEGGYSKYAEFQPILDILNNWGFNTSEEQQKHSWLGIKQFSDYGHSKESIVSNIMKEISEIRNALNV